jgi:hypothetical protein
MDFGWGQVPSSIAGMPAMLLGETRWWDPTNAAVGSDFVVVAPPDGDLGPGLVQVLEPGVVETLVAAGGHRGPHVQPRRQAAADIDVAAAGQSAGLVRRRHRTAPMGLRRRQGAAMTGRAAGS